MGARRELKHARFSKKRLVKKLKMAKKFKKTIKKLTKPRFSVSTSVLVKIASHHTKTRITKPILKVMRKHKKQVKTIKKVLRKTTLKVMKLKKTISSLKK